MCVCEYVCEYVGGWVGGEGEGGGGSTAHTIKMLSNVIDLHVACLYNKVRSPIDFKKYPCDKYLSCRVIISPISLCHNVPLSSL